MRLTLDELKQVISESIDGAMPDRDSLENQLYSAQGNAAATAKLLSTLERKLSRDAKGHFPSFSHAVRMWSLGRGQYAAVNAAMDKLYAPKHRPSLVPPPPVASEPAPRQSHICMKAVVPPTTKAG